MIPLKRHLALLLFLNYIITGLHAQQQMRKDSLLEQIKSSHEPAFTAGIYLELSLLTYAADADESAKWAQKVFHLPDKNISSRQKGDAYAYFGRAMSKLNNMDSAILLYEKSINFYEETQDTFLLARMHNAIGVKYMNNGMYPQALQSLIKALNLLENLGPGYERGKASLINNIGNIYYHQKKYDEALENYQQAKALIPMHQDTFIIANTYNNLGIIYDARNELDTALAHYEKALAAYRYCDTKSLYIIVLQGNGLDKTYCSSNSILPGQRMYGAAIIG